MADRIPIFPLHSLLLPHTDLGLHVFEDRYRELVAYALDHDGSFGVVLIKTGQEVGGPAEPHDVGTLAQISGYAKLPDGRYLLEVEGTTRFRINGVHANGSYPSARVTFIHEAVGHFGEVRSASETVAHLFHLYRAGTGDADLPVHLPADPIARSYLVASHMRIDASEKQLLLEFASAEERLRAEQAILEREIATLDDLRASRT